MADSQLINSATFEEIELGARAAFRRTISLDDIDRFAALSGDYNPLHTDEAYAAATPFQRRVVHGMFLASLLSRLVGMHLPGRRCLYLSQDLNFSEPVFAGDEVEVTGEVKSKQEATQTLVIRTEIIALPGRLAVRGKAIVRVLA